MNITDILDELGIPYKEHHEHHHVTAGWVNTDCPGCGATERYRLGVHKTTLACSCWTCGRLRLWEALTELSNKPIAHIATLLQGVECDDVATTRRLGKLVLPQGIVPLLPAHKKYLRQRGFNPATIERLWGVQGLDHTAGIYRTNSKGERYWQTLKWRLFIPIIQYGVTVSWTTRTIADKPGVKRYITASDAESAVPRGKVLYGEDNAKHAISVHEGCIDAWAVGPGAVATLGLGYSKEQLQRMLKYPVRGICFDKEGPAQARARQLADELAAYPGETFVIGLDAKDAAVAPKQEIKGLRELLHL